MSDDLARFSTLFAALDEAGRKKLMALSKKKTFEAGAVICKEGDAAFEFYVLTKGTATVSGDDLGNEKQVGTLKAGDFFGEMAALTGQKRQATVTAAEAVEVICFPPAAVTEVVKAQPAAAQVMQKAGLSRTEELMKKLME